ncbi:MAG: TolC family protein [Bacteroidota bacterium]
MKVFKKPYIPLVAAILCIAFAKAQTETNTSTLLPTLALEEAIGLTLENNYSINIEKKRSKIAEEQFSIGNAGLLPTINLIGNGSYANNNTELTIRTFQEPPAPAIQSFDDSGVATTTLQGVVQADYTVFAGFRGRYQFKVLESQNRISKLQEEATINQTILEVSTLFLEIAKLQRRQELLEKSIAITRDRVRRIEHQKEFGKATGLDVLNVESNLNRDLTQLDQILLAQNNLKRDLNFLIGSEPERQYRVSVIYETKELPEATVIQERIVSGNPQLLLAHEGIQIGDYQIELAKSRLYPQLDVFANYGAFYQENDLQQLAEITNIGYTAGATLRFNIFDGSRIRTAIRTAELEKETTIAQQEQLENRLITDAFTEINRIRILEAQLSRELENLVLFQEAFTRTESRFKNGKATNLDLRDAQTALLNAEITIAELQADLMNAYIVINTITGLTLNK